MASGRYRKLELLVVAVVLGVLLHLLLNALSVVQRELEEATVQSEVSALRVELLDRLSHREGFGGSLPPGDNPVVWAGREPAGYVGEADDVPANSVWFFRRRDGQLVYRFRAGDEWRFRLVRVPQGNAGALLGGVGLVRVDTGVGAK